MPYVTRILSLVFILVCAAMTPAAADDLQPILTAAMKGTATPAVGAAVIRNGKLVALDVRGRRRVDKPDPVKPDDVWLIGSDAKPMTATLIAKLVSEGKLSWTAPLSEMLPTLAKDMRADYRSVTLVELLSHRAGLPHDISDMTFFNAFFTDKRALPEQRLAYLARALKDAPVAPPGTKFSYSNTGFLLAAAIAEQATHTPYETLMRQEVFEPLGMTSVGFGVTHDGEPMGHHAGKVAMLMDANPAMFAPAGNIHLDLADWAKFCIDQMAGMKGQGKLMPTDAYRRMQTPVAPGVGAGLSWGVQDAVMGRKGPALTHAGSDGNWYALVVLFPETGDGLLSVANAGDDMGGDKATKAVFKALLPTVSTPK